MKNTDTIKKLVTLLDSDNNNYTLYKKYKLCESDCKFDNAIPNEYIIIDNISELSDDILVLFNRYQTLNF